MVTQKLIVFGEQNFADEEEELYATTIRFSEAMSLLMKYLKYLTWNPWSNKRCMYLWTVRRDFKETWCCITNET